MFAFGAWAVQDAKLAAAAIATKKANFFPFALNALIIIILRLILLQKSMCCEEESFLLPVVLHRLVLKE